MKKKMIVIIAAIVFLLIAFLIRENMMLKEQINENNVSSIPKKNYDMLSMMLETKTNSGNYEMTTRDSWPTEGYIFNSELSKCENGGELSWDKEKKVVLMSGNKSDKCYVYFDIIPTIADICTSGENLSTCVKSFGDKGYDISKIYIHNSSLQNGANDNSYRYAGAHDVVDNFVCFGTDTKPCPDDNLYRIIGVFGDKVKLIKYDYATKELLGEDGDYYGMYIENVSSNAEYKGNNLANISNYNWNKSNQNIWSLSNLNKINLNKNFITKIGPKWAEKIAETTWNIGGNLWNEIAGSIPYLCYKNEVIKSIQDSISNNEIEYNAKIGLMYVSDYGFAAASSAWTTILNKYDNESVIKINWIYMGLWEWTITRLAYNSAATFRIGNSGYVDTNTTDANFLAIRPTFYLSNSVSYLSGSGTKTDPIILGD